jgi:hypothetical protein
MVILLLPTGTKIHIVCVVAHQKIQLKKEHAIIILTNPYVCLYIIFRTLPVQPVNQSIDGWIELKQINDIKIMLDV